MSPLSRAILASAVTLFVCGARPAVAGGLDPNTYRPGHPASPHWVVQHAGQPHPALLTSEAGRHPALDVNQYRVQPPASAHWTAGR